jgi:hypothetical protein
MYLIGECKEDFDNWYELHYEAIGLKSIDDEFYIDGFYELPESMQYGIYVDFFDSVGLFPNIMPLINDNNERVFQSYQDENHIQTFDTRLEARAAAIQKANEIYNLDNK